MNMLAFSSLACPHWSVESIIRRAAEYGYEGIEWRGGAEGHIHPGIPAAQITSLRKRSDDAGLTALAVTSYTSFVSPRAEERKSNVDELRRYADLAAEIGARYVRAFLGELPPYTKPDEAIYKTISDCLSIASAYAATVGVNIAVEPHDNFVRSPVVAPILNRGPSPAELRVIWDLGNTFAAGEGPKEGFEILKDRLAYVQVKDGRRLDSGWQLCAVGEGDVPLVRAFELLLDHGYEGAFSVEWEYAWHPELDPPEIALPAALRTIRKLLSAKQSESV